MTLALDHVAIPVHDAAATCRFYGEVLELPLVDALYGDDWGGHPWLMMIFGLAEGRQIALVALRGVAPAEDPRLPRDVRHVAMSVATLRDLDRWKQRLGAHHIEYVEEDHGAQRSIYFSDPSGVMLEITAPPAAVAAPVQGARAIVDGWLAG